MRLTLTFRMVSLLLLGLIGLLYGLSLLGNPEGNVWRKSWSGDDQQAFGAELLRDMVSELMAPAVVLPTKRSPEKVMNAREVLGSEQSAYVFVNETFDPMPADWDELLHFVALGNSVWISASAISQEVGQALGIALRDIDLENREWLASDDSLTLYFTRKDWPSQAFHIPVRHVRRIEVIETVTEEDWEEEELENESYAFSQPSQVEILARTQGGQPLSLKITYGKGAFFLSAFPVFITNYGLLDPTYEPLVAGLFSVLPNNTQVVFWDEWIKVGNPRHRSPDRSSSSQSPWSFIWKEEALRMALILASAGLLLLGIFQTGRVQRIIPEYPPLPNMTLDFVDTVGRLYFQQQNHSQLARKRILLFKQRLHDRYFLPEDWGSAAFVRLLAAKSGLEPRFVQQLIQQILSVEKREELSEAELIELSQMLDFFTHKTVS